MITRATLSTIEQGLPKYRSMLAGNAAYDPGSYDLIASVVVGTGGSSLITFSSIPQTYASLEVWSLSAPETAGAADLQMRMNNDSGASNYAWSAGYGPSSGTAASFLNNSSTSYITSVNGAGRGAPTFAMTIWSIPDYTSTNKHKSLNHWGGFATNDGSDINYVTGFWGSGRWKSTTAINRLDFLLTSSADIAEYSVFSLFGLKGA